MKRLNFATKWTLLWRNKGNFRWKANDPNFLMAIKKSTKSNKNRRIDLDSKYMEFSGVELCRTLPNFAELFIVIISNKQKTEQLIGPMYQINRFQVFLSIIIRRKYFSLERFVFHNETWWMFWGLEIGHQ